MATYIGQVALGGNNLPVASTLYGTCATAAGTAAKVVTCANFDKLITGVTIYVKFTYSNTVANPTLNVNSTGAKAIERYGTTAPSTSAATSWNAGSVIAFTYDGQYWQMVGWLNNNDMRTAASATPLMDGTATVGTSAKYAREDHVHPTDTSRAPLASPALTGTPTAPTATAGTNSTQIATTAFVASALSSIAGPMRFIGSLGTGGTATSLPEAAESNKGHSYKVITAGTYQGVAAKVGDMLVSTGSGWTLIPSGDEPSGTVTSVGISNATNGGLTITSSPITTSGTISIGHTNVLTNAQTTQALYPIKIDKNGHISAYGTAVTSLPASDVSAWAKATTKPTYNWGEISQSGANNIDEGTSDFTDNTEIFSSYASNNGFVDTNALGKVYRRDAVHMYNYVKSKLAVTNNNINLSRNTETTIATIGGTAIKIKLPASDNTDTKQNVTLATTSKAYITGVTTTPTSSAQALTGVADTGVYLTTTAGEISATRHSFNVNGTEKAYMVFNSTTNAIDFIFN